MWQVNRMRHEKFQVYVPCGSRLDFLLAVNASCKIHFPKCPPYIVQCFAHEAQSVGHVPTFSVALQGPAVTTTFPASCQVNRCRSSAWESLRVRCGLADCKHRPTAEAAVEDSKADTDPKREIPNDDKEKEADGESMDVTETAGEPGTKESDMLDANAALSKKRKRDPVDVFTSTKPLHHFQQVFENICSAPASSYLVAMTRSAHPGLPVAARLARFEVIALVENATEHSRNHGKELMDLFWRNLKWNEALAASSAEIRRVHAAECQFALVPAPPADTQMVLAPLSNRSSCSFFVGVSRTLSPRPPLAFCPDYPLDKVVFCRECKPPNQHLRAHSQ